MTRHGREEGGRGEGGEKENKACCLCLAGSIANSRYYGGTHAVLNKNSLKSLTGLKWSLRGFAVIDFVASFIPSLRYPKRSATSTRSIEITPGCRSLLEAALAARMREGLESGTYQLMDSGTVRVLQLNS